MKRILGILILLVGTVGVFCSVIAAPYVWTTIDRVKVNLLAFTEALDEPLNVVDEKVEQAQGAIGKTMKGVKKANGFVDKLADNQLSDEQAKQLEKITNELNEYFQVAHMLVRVGAGGAEAFAKSEGLVKRVPFLKNTQVSADDIRQAADGLAELSKLFDELDGKIKKARADKTGAQEIRKVVTDLSGRIDSKLSTAKARLEDFDSKLTEARNELDQLKERLPGWIDTVKIILVVIIVWFGVGQFSLLAHGWSMMRGRTQN